LCIRTPSLRELQNRIVDERFPDHDYRSSQNYVGQTVSYGNAPVHCVPPKPGDLSTLMDEPLAKPPEVWRNARRGYLRKDFLRLLKHTIFNQSVKTRILPTTQ